MSTATKVSPSEEQAIRSRIDEFASAWNKHDPHAMASVQAEDADLINPVGRVAKSRTQIESLLKEEHSGPLKDSHLSVQPEGIRFLATDVAIADHAFEMSGARDPSGKEVSIRGHLTLVLKKHGNAWFITASRPMVPLPMPGTR